MTTCLDAASGLASRRLEGFLMACACCRYINHAAHGSASATIHSRLLCQHACQADHQAGPVLRAPAHVRPPDFRGTHEAAAHLGEAAAVAPAPLRPRRQAGGHRVRLGHPRPAWPLQLALQAHFACRQSGARGPARHHRRHPGCILFAQTWLLQRPAASVLSYEARRGSRGVLESRSASPAPERGLQEERRHRCLPTSFVTCEASRSSAAAPRPGCIKSMGWQSMPHVEHAVFINR